MPDLRELLEGAVDAPAPFDLGDVGRRVGRQQRRRRSAFVGVAVAALAIVAGAAVAARDDGGDRVDTEPASPATDSGPDGSPTTKPEGVTSTPRCTADDLSVDVVPGVPDTDGDLYLGLSALPADIDAEPCTIDTTVTFTLRDVGTDQVLEVEGNGVGVPMVGVAGGGQSGASSMNEVIWTGCLPGVAAGDRGEAVVEAEVEGIGTYRATTGGPVCGDPADGSRVQAFDPDAPTIDLPECTADDVVVEPGGEGATAQMVLGVGVTLAPGAEPCSMNTTATVTLVDPKTGEPFEVDLHNTDSGEDLPGGGNPFTVHLRGSLGRGQPGVGADELVTWAGCAPGGGDLVADEYTLRVTVDGFGDEEYEGSTVEPRCEEPDGANSFVAVGAR